MPVVVACRCGKRFAAKDHLYGRHVRCPACDSDLAIERHADAGTDGVYVTCACGRGFLAPEAMRGQQGRCRGCGRVLQVPGPDPLAIVPVSAPRPAMAAPAPSPPALEDDEEIPWRTLKRIGAVGGSILLVLFVITTIIEYWPRQLAVPKAEHISKFVEAARQKIAPPAAPAGTTAQAATNEAQGESTSSTAPLPPSAEGPASASGDAAKPSYRSPDALPTPPGTIIIPVEGVDRLAISPDGKLLLVAAHEGVRLWDISQAKPKSLDFLPSRENGEHRLMPHTIAFAADNRTVAMVTTLGTSIVRAPDLRQVRMVIPELFFPRHVQFSNEGAQLYGIWTGNYEVYDLATGNRSTVVPTLSFTHDDFAVEPDLGKVWRANPSGITVYSVADKRSELYYHFDIREGYYKLAAMSANGKWVAGFTEERIDLWDVAQKRVAATWPMKPATRWPLRSPRITSEGQFVIANDGARIHVWDAIKGKEAARWDVGGMALQDFVIADEGRRLAAGEGIHTNEVRIFSLPGEP